ncbi:MAG TPA: STAS/SEC14 domain-containing protein [Bacteroidia bacterium]|nr:STAS/SEC14 domain-containing protein [Bacteroidia bacterium]
MLAPGPNDKIIETATSTMWFDQSGILCSISKKHPPQTIEEMQKSLDEFMAITSGKKLCMLADITNASTVNKETREFAAAELTKIVKAIALVSTSPLGKMVANLFFALKPPTYPMRMFNDVDEAREWLKKHL